MKPNVGISAVVILFCACMPAAAQWKEPPATGSPANELPDRTTLAGQAGMGPLLEAKLVDAEGNARNHKAVVDVQTDGVNIVDPSDKHQPKIDEVHIQYRLDNEPVQNTSAKSWTFDHLSSGNHLVRVALATSDDRQLGKERSLRVKVP